jgi:mRNA interferase RelE/StbE
MSYLIEYQPEALDDLEKLTQSVRERIVKKIIWLSENFEQINPQSLTADLSGFFKLRVGDYRVIGNVLDVLPSMENFAGIEETIIE